MSSKKVCEFQLIAVKDASKMTCVSEPTVMLWMRKRYIKSYRVGRRWLIDKASLIGFIKANEY